MCQSVFLGWSLMGCLYFVPRKHILESSLTFARCRFLSPVFGTRSHATLFTWKQISLCSYPRYIPV